MGTDIFNYSQTRDRRFPRKTNSNIMQGTGSGVFRQFEVIRTCIVEAVPVWLNLVDMDDLRPGDGIEDYFRGHILSRCCTEGGTHLVVTVEKDGFRVG